MAEKSITVFCPHCSTKFSMYYQEEETSSSLPSIETAQSDRLQKRREKYAASSEQQREKRREYQRRWFQKKFRKEKLLAKAVKMEAKEQKKNGKISHVQGSIGVPPKEDSMMAQIRRYLANHADSFHSLKEIYGTIDGLTENSASAMVVQMYQRKLIERRRSENGKWEYAYKKI
jgi:hypothetical protein